MKALISLISGFIFAIGLGLSGMTQPQKIVGFLDVFGDWDPTLIFVMVGAIAVHSISYLTLNRSKKPVFSLSYSVPNKNDLTKSLITGSFLFGIGWGLSGFCPGPGIVSLFSGNQSSLLFVGFMIIGILCNRLVSNFKKANQ